IRFFHLVDAAELAPRRRARVIARQSAPHVLVGEQIEMRLNLVVQLRIAPTPPKQSGHSSNEDLHRLILTSLRSTTGASVMRVPYTNLGTPEPRNPGTPEPGSRDHSYLSATIGSTRLALRAGTYPAA